jgi:prevent-host-death family protein
VYTPDVKFGYVGVREARAHLAELLDDAERGKVTFVTRHGRAVAAIAPAALLESFEQALDALPPKMDNAADLAWRTEDGSTVYAQVKVYSDRPAEAEQPEEGGETGKTPDIQLVVGPPGTGKTEVIAAILKRLRPGQSLVLLGSADQLPPLVADAGAAGDPSEAKR